jgi:hypothetical protein
MTNLKPLAFVAILLLGFTAHQSPIVQSVNAIGAWHRTDAYFVPVSWCAVIGSQADANPNVPNPPSPRHDTTAHDILIRRLDRATENIYINQAGIAFRSALGSVWGAGGLRELTFSHIEDTDTTHGVRGDIMSPEEDRTEVNQILNKCTETYGKLGKGGTGINAINVNLFHWKDGKYIGDRVIDGKTVKDQVFYGLGGCMVVLSTGLCSTPYSPFIVVADNHYLMDGISPRTFPGGGFFTLTDPIDQAVGHELGHALGLKHRAISDSKAALMYPFNQDNDHDSRADNIHLSSAEVTTARSTALKVSQVLKDPPNKFLNGDVVETIKAGKILENNVPPYLDLSLMRIALDTKTNNLSVGQQLFDLIPQGPRNLEYWTLIDSDNNTKTGASANTLQGIGVPRTKFMGADLVSRAEVNGIQIVGNVWQFHNGALIRLPINSFHSDLLSNIGYMDSGTATGAGVIRHQSASSTGIPINNVVSITMNNNITKIGLNKPFNIQAITLQRGLPITDKLDKSIEEHGMNFVLEHGAFAQCFPHGDAKAGQNATIDVSGLKPNSKIHGTLGSAPVFDGQTNRTGGGTIHFSIPINTKDGLHLITVGIDKTAVTADCAINVKASPVSQ